MKKQGKKRVQNNNPYNLNDYRNKRENTLNKETTQKKSNYKQNPYRNQYNIQEDTPRHSQVDAYQRKQRRTYTESKSAARAGQARAISSTPEQRRATIKKTNKLSRQQSINLKKKKKMQSIRRMLLMVFIGIFISYSGVRVIDLFTYPPISYQTVRQGTIDNTQMLEGIIVREEKVVRTGKKGDIHYVIGEGEKVSKNGDVCFITDDKQIEVSLNKINTLDESIYNMQDKRSNMSYFQAEIHQLNLEVVDEMKEFYYSQYWKNPKKVYTMRKELERVIQNRTSIYINDRTELTEELQTERVELQNQLKNVHDAYKAEVSGIISYQIDNLEGVLTSQVAGTMNYNQFKNIKKSKVDAVEPEDDVEIQEVKDNKIDEVDGQKEKVEEALENKQTSEVTPLEKESESASNSYPLYKIITDDEWHVITYVEQADAVSYEEGKKYELYFGNHTYQEPIMFKLATKVEEGKYTKLIFSSKDKLSEFLNTRVVNFSVGKNTASGLKIPLKAVVEKNVMKIPSDYIVTQDRISGVYKKQGENSIFTPVDVQYKTKEEENEYIYVLQQIDNPLAIRLGDILQSAEGQQTYTINKVETVEGVYSINGSYAKFKPIEIVMSNKDYAILSKGRETVLKEFDQIISNPKNIKEDQLLKYMNIKNE